MQTTEIQSGFKHITHDNRMVIRGVNIPPGKMQCIDALLADRRVDTVLVTRTELSMSRENSFLTTFELNIRFSRLDSGKVVELDKTWLKAIQATCPPNKQI